VDKFSIQSWIFFDFFSGMAAARWFIEQRLHPAI
jgi:hypothetical protein